MAYQVIVVGTDGSERGTGAVQEAMELAGPVGATLHVVQVVHPAVGAGQVDSEAWQQVIDDERGRIDSVRSSLVAEADRRGLALEFHTPGGGDVADALISTAESVGAELVVVGNKGMTGMSRFVLGSIPNKVAHRCRCSVLIANTDPT
jgi:nucleotide-binding universal stress UspA family protein